jgi:hypothetical protein
MHIKFVLYFFFLFVCVVYVLQLVYYNVVTLVWYSKDYFQAMWRHVWNIFAHRLNFLCQKSLVASQLTKLCPTVSISSHCIHWLFSHTFHIYIWYRLANTSIQCLILYLVVVYVMCKSFNNDHFFSYKR